MSKLENGARLAEGKETLGKSHRSMAKKGT